MHWRHPCNLFIVTGAEGGGLGCVFPAYVGSLLLKKTFRGFGVFLFGWLVGFAFYFMVCIYNFFLKQFAKS